MVITKLWKLSIWIQLEKGRDTVKLMGGLKKDKEKSSKNGLVANIG